MTYTHAIARRPAVNTGDGATSADLGAPDPSVFVA